MLSKTARPDQRPTSRMDTNAVCDIRNIAMTQRGNSKNRELQPSTNCKRSQFSHNSVTIQSQSSHSSITSTIHGKILTWWRVARSYLLQVILHLGWAATSTCTEHLQHLYTYPHRHQTQSRCSKNRNPRAAAECVGIRAKRNDVGPPFQDKVSYSYARRRRRERHRLWFNDVHSGFGGKGKRGALRALFTSTCKWLLHRHCCSLHLFFLSQDVDKHKNASRTPASKRGSRVRNGRTHSPPSLC